jgi:uncharacterized protein (DUF58 family)
MEPATPQLFDDEFLKKLEYLNVLSRRVKAERRVEKRLKKRGAGLEFADYRPYVAGDDFRHLDWKAYLRLDRLILKLFEEREDLPIYFFVDASRSMESGQPSKLHYARQVAAALSYIALANLDRINLIAYGDRVKAELPPQRGKGRIFRIFGFLDAVTPAGETNARQSFRTYCTRLRRRGLAVVISDFLDPEGFERGLDVLRHFRHDIFLVHVTTREEIDPPLQGALQIVDSENRTTREVVMTPSLLEAYRAEFEHYCRSIEAYCRRYQLGYIRTETDVPFDELVMAVLRQGRFVK